MKIIAIGGGGFTHGTFPELDDFCVQQSGAARPRIAFIGTASRDDPEKIGRFDARFAGVCETRVHLPMTLPAAALARELERIDLVYVGGGDTEAMVAAWRRNGWDRVLGDAYRAGVTLSGVSAGAVCWFDAFLFRSGQGPMRPLPGLGLIPLGACPHYSTETDRHSALHKTVAEGRMPVSIAIDDGVAVVFDDGRPKAVCNAVPGAGAYRVSRSGNGIVETPLSIA